MRTKLIFFIFYFFSVGLVFAQPGDPGGGDPDVPITGIEILIGIGSAFGASRFLKGKLKSKKEL